MLEYLFTTPYTPRSSSERSGDLLGWRRLRQKLQRQLFAPFTVLTPKRCLAEVLMISLRLIHDPELSEILPRARRSEERKLFRHLEILFGLASIFGVRSPKNFAELRNNAPQNPYRILNIERVQAFLEDCLENHPNASELGYKTGCNYLDKLPYGIGPHYMSSLIRFGIVNESRRLNKTKTDLFPLKRNEYEQIREIVSHWFGSGVTFEELKILHNAIWQKLTINYDKRSELWLTYINETPVLSGTVLLTLCDLIYKRNIKAATADELKLKVYELALDNARNGGQKGSIDLLVCLVKCRTFEVVTTLADFLLYCLILFAEDSGGKNTLKAFCRTNSSWLHQVTVRLAEALRLAQELGLTELHNWLELPSKGKSIGEINVLRAILARHFRIKGSSMTFVDYSESSDLLMRTEKHQDDLGKARTLILKFPTEGPIPLPELIRKDTLKESVGNLFGNDEVWESFIGGNFLWQTFGNWFYFLPAAITSNNQKAVEQ